MELPMRQAAADDSNEPACSLLRLFKLLSTDCLDALKEPVFQKFFAWISRVYFLYSSSTLSGLTSSGIFGSIYLSLVPIYFYVYQKKFLILLIIIIKYINFLMMGNPWLRDWNQSKFIDFNTTLYRYNYKNIIISIFGKTT